VVTSAENMAVGFLVEIDGFEGSDDLLRAARLAGAMSMLARSGFKLVLLPIPSAAPIRRATRHRWWRR
jgi:hypothetical protein